MIYQRHIPKEELFSAQLEMLMQHGRLAMVGTHLVGVLATVALFWPFVGLTTILLWAAAFLILLLVRSLQMSNALVEHRYRSRPRRVYRQLLIGAAVTGAVWAAVYIYASTRVPLSMQYMFLLLIIMIIAFSLGFSVMIREYYIVYVFTCLWPIAWWSMAHYWQQPHNALIGLVLLAFCALLISVTEKTYTTFHNMISLNWEREAMAQELGDLTGSLRDRNRQLSDARRQLTDLANIDELTGLGNRRLVNKVLQEEVNRARRSGAELSVILLDVDYFKSYNDTYGHTAGDVVLQKLADIMQNATTRAGEVVARYGGEEFIVVLPGASPVSARRIADRLQELIAEANIPHESSTVGTHITISQGVITVCPDADLEPTDLIKRADKVLYEAKGAGRNAIVVEESAVVRPTNP
jgi:diguanylate cyclase (GGDEF)-like protein